MSAPAPETVVVPTGPMLVAMVGGGLICGLLIVLAYQGTKPIIQKNQVEARQAAVFEVLPGAVETRTFHMGEDGHFSVVPDDSQGEGLAFAGFDAQGQLIGIALEGSGMGYQDTIRLLYGYSPEQQAVIGIKVLESRETPGLGTRVESDPGFLKNFEKLDVRLDAAGQALAHPIAAVKSGTKTDPWQIDCITGATISSTAVSTILRDSTAWWVPRLQASIQDFRRTE